VHTPPRRSYNVTARGTNRPYGGDADLIVRKIEGQLSNGNTLRTLD
jgi:hypothetical protein